VKSTVENDYVEWEREEQLLSELISGHLYKGKIDRWKWIGEEDDTYYVRSTYVVLQNITTIGNNNMFKDFWDVKTLPNVQIFV